MLTIGSLLSAVVLQLAPGSPAVGATPLRPVVFTGEASQLTTTAATLNGSVDPSNQPTNFYFQYGASNAYGSQTPLAVAGEGTKSIHVTAALTGLTANTTYHYRLVAVNAAGATDGQDRTFTTKKNPLAFMLSASPSPDPFRTPFSVSGTLSGSENANQKLVLQANPFPYLSGFNTIGAPTTTDATGHFSFLVPGLTENTQLRVATQDTPPMVSPVLVEFVAVRVKLRIRSTRRPGFVRFYGTVTPAEVGAQVGIQLLRHAHNPRGVGTAFVLRGTPTVSRFSLVVHVTHPGHYRAFVYVVSGAQASNHSQTILVR